MVAISVFKILSADIVGRGKPLYVTYASIVSFGATLVLDVLLIPQFGIVGAAAASTIAYIISAVMLSVAYVRLSRNKVYSFLCITKEDLQAYPRLLRRRLS